MTFGIAVVVFVGALMLSAVSSLVLANNLEKIGSRLKLSEGLLGIITALAADSPEISSAVIALLSDHHDLGIGVVLGSNIFNLAALLGLSAIIVGKVNIDQPVLVLNGTVTLIVSAIAAALVFKVTTPLISVILILILLIPYTVISSLRSSVVAHWRLPTRLKKLLCSLVDDVHHSARKDKTASYATRNDMLAVVPALTAIILASFGLVRSAVFIGEAWNVPHLVLGTLILATLTGIPNMLAAIRLAQHNRGSAVVSEALNSNTFNILSGICLPALILGLKIVSDQTLFASWWLLGMTGLTVWLTYRHQGLDRLEGSFIVLLYTVFVGTIILGT